MEVTATTKIDQEVEVSVHIDDLIEAINKLRITLRYNYIGQLLNGIDLGDMLELEDGQREIIAKYLKEQLNRFENNKV